MTSIASGGLLWIRKILRPVSVSGIQSTELISAHRVLTRVIYASNTRYNWAVKNIKLITSARSRSLHKNFLSIFSSDDLTFKSIHHTRDYRGKNYVSGPVFSFATTIFWLRFCARPSVVAETGATFLIPVYRQSYREIMNSDNDQGNLFYTNCYYFL